MARRKTNDLENQMSLMDMMASESPEYTEEGPEELLDPGEDMGDSEGQTDKPFKLVANKTTKTKVSISTQALSVVKAVYADTVETNWEELFDGFDRLYAITFSSGIEFVNKVINKFSYAEVVFGCEKIIANDIAAIMSVQIDSVQRLAKSKSAGNLANRLDDGSLQLYVSRDTKSHEKIFILESADHKRVRVITGSANMSASAFCGIQRENIVCFDDEAAFSHYKVLFETFKETCSDNVSYKAVVNTMNQEDYLKENIKEVPVFQSIEKQKLVFLEQAQPEDEVEYEIVADVKKMQELVKPIMPKMPVQANRIVVAAEPMRVFGKRYTEVRRVAAEAVKQLPKLHIDYDAGTMTFNDENIVIIFAALILMILVSAYLGFARHNVKKTSERLNALKELNNTTEFMPVEAQYRYYLRSDTKLEYEEFSLPKFFRREVRKNFKLYNTLLGNARANTVLYETYGREIQELPDWTESDDDCGRHIPFFLYHNIEKELYDETVLDCPVTSPEFVCTKSYLPKDAKEPIETEETYTLEELEEYIRRLKVAADVKKNSQNAG